MEARDSVYDGKRANIESDSDFSNIYSMYTTDERSEPKKI